MKLFELHPPVVRGILHSNLSIYPKVRIDENSFNTFTIFTVTEETDSADFRFIVNSEVNHFEFNVGPYIMYEGDYTIYPPTINFLEEFIYSMANGNIIEKRSYIFGIKIFEPSKIYGQINFKTYDPYIMSIIGISSFFSFIKEDKIYTPYRT